MTQMTTNKPLEANASLTEAQSNLIEVCAGGSVEVIEEATSEGKPKKVKVRGHFGNVGIATANKRLYPKTLWEREISRLEKNMSDRLVFGELDHPSDGRTLLNRVSHIITGLKIDGDQIIGEAEILDTDAGRNLQALLKAGCKVGISSRGYGSVKPNMNGEDVVQDDYKLVSFDFVADPAAGAFPRVFIESKGQRMEAKNLTVEMLSEMNPELITDITTKAVTDAEAGWADKIETAKIEAAEAERESLKEAFSRELVVLVSKAKAELREEVTKEVMADPAITGAAVALEQVKAILQPYILPADVSSSVLKMEATAKEQVAEAKKAADELAAKLKAVEEENGLLTDTLREVGYKYHVEMLIAGDVDAALIRKMVGDVKGYSSADDIKTKIEALKADLASKRASEQATVKAQTEEAQVAVKAESAEATEKLARAARMMEAYESKLGNMEEALAKALEAQKETQKLLYAERKLTNHPKAAKIRSVIESGNLETTADIDRMFENFREPERDSEALDSVRARVRAATRGGRGSTALDEEVGPVRGDSTDVHGLGISRSDFMKLSGIGNKK
jgi:hypothetical protein